MTTSNTTTTTAPAYLLPEVFALEHGFTFGTPCPDDGRGTIAYAYTEEELTEIDAKVREEYPREKWTTDPDDSPGPRQVSAFNKALGGCTRREGFTQALKGTVGNPDGQGLDGSEVFIMFGFSPKHPAISKALRDFGTRHGWTISRKNASAATKELGALANELRRARPWVKNELDTQEDVDKQREAHADYAEQEKTREAKREENSGNLAAIMAKRPANASAIIIATLDENESDLHTGYHAHKTTRTVVIGWRTGNREDFRQLRKAADTYPATAHLGTGKDDWSVTANADPEAERQRWSRETPKDESGREVRFTTEADAVAYVTEGLAKRAQEEKEYPRACDFWDFAEDHGVSYHKEKVEHRENYSMGAGNYLKNGGRDCSGWKVKSVSIGKDGTPGYGLAGSGHDLEDGLPGPRTSATTTTTSTGGAGAFEILETENKRGPMSLVVQSERVERAEFERLRDSAKRAGGWYSRKWGRTPGGYAFNSTEDAQAWADSEFGAPTPTDDTEGPTLPDPTGPLDGESLALLADNQADVPRFTWETSKRYSPTDCIEDKSHAAYLKGKDIETKTMGAPVLIKGSGAGDYGDTLKRGHLTGRQVWTYGGEGMAREAITDAGREWSTNWQNDLDGKHIGTTPQEDAREREATRLEDLADGMTAEIERLRAPLTQNWTHRRQGIKDGQKARADNDETTQKALRAIAAHTRANTMPGRLAGLSSKAGVRKLLFDYTTSVVTLDARAWLLCQTTEGETDADKQATEERKQAEELETLENSVRGFKIPGFFPTPPAVVARVVELLQLEPGDDILEPSAGLGHLAQPLKEHVEEHGGTLFCYETHFKLAGILRLKGFATSGVDFTHAYKVAALAGTLAGHKVDRIAMNPPFEKKQDETHARTAHALLRPGGRLVAVVTPRTAQALEEDLGGWVEELPAGSFTGADAFRQTGVSAALWIFDA